MTVRIVTDSSSDLPSTLALKHEIEVVPLNVHFRNEEFKYGTEITPEQFFKKLIKGPIHPAITNSSTGEFIDTYRKIAENEKYNFTSPWQVILPGSVNKPDDQIVSIHDREGWVNASQASRDLNGEIEIHAIASTKVSMSLGLSAIAAAKVAKRGGSVAEVISAVVSAEDRGRFVALFDTWEYLAKQNRIGKAQSLLYDLLKIRPILTEEYGELIPYTKARSRKAGLSKLEQAIKSFGDIEELYVMYSTNTTDAEILAENLSDLLPAGKKPMVMRIGPVIGRSAGPDLIAVGCMTTVRDRFPSGKNLRRPNRYMRWLQNSRR